MAHHLEFDAGTILHELARCGLGELHGAWKRIAQGGFCTMAPEVGRWVLNCSGSEVGPPTAKHCLGLKNIARRMLADIPNIDALLEQHHDPGVDAQLTGMVYMRLLEWAKAVS